MRSNQPNNDDLPIKDIKSYGYEQRLFHKKRSLDVSGQTIQFQNSRMDSPGQGIQKHLSSKSIQEEQEDK